MDELSELVARAIRDATNCGKNADGTERQFPCSFCHWKEAEEETGCISQAEAVIAALQANGFAIVRLK